MERVGPGKDGGNSFSRDAAKIHGGGGADDAGKQEELQQEAEIGVPGLLS